jgi:hypothetical protein
MLRHLAHHPESGALWIDTTGEFSAERIAQILGSNDEQVVNIFSDPSAAIDV